MAKDMNKSSSKKENVIRLFRQPLALIIWFYIIVKLFIFDIDIYCEKLILPHADFINYKFVLIILATAVLLLIMGDLFLSLIKRNSHGSQPTETKHNLQRPF